MKKVKDEDEMRDEYDFSKGVRGKHFRKMHNGYTTIIHQSDGSTVVKETRPIFLDEDVKAYFPDAKAVNDALRGLIALVPNK